MPIFLIKSIIYGFIRINQPAFVSRETGQNDMIIALIKANHAVL
jgi:hypothetical protein